MKHQDIQTDKHFDYIVKIWYNSVEKGQIKIPSIFKFANLRQKINEIVNLQGKDIFLLQRKINTYDNFILYDIFLNHTTPSLLIVDAIEITHIPKEVKYTYLEIKEFPTRKEIINIINLFLKRSGRKLDYKEIYSDNSIILLFKQQETAFAVIKKLNKEKFTNNLLSKLNCILTGATEPSNKNSINMKKSQHAFNLLGESIDKPRFLNNGVLYKNSYDMSKIENRLEKAKRVQHNMTFKKLNIDI